MSTLIYTICGSEVLLLGICNVSLFVPTLVTVFLLKHESFHCDAVSDIPGNPHAFSNAIISLFRTLPEPSNFNIVWTGLSLDEPFLIRGRIPLCRYSSMSVYGAGSSDPPNSTEICAIGNGRMCEVLVTPNGSPDLSDYPNRIVLKTNKWRKGFISMRNYLVPPGTGVTTPEIIRISDGKVIRPSKLLVSGPCTLDMRVSKWALSAAKCLALNVTAVILNSFFLQGVLSTAHIVIIVVLSGLMGIFIYNMCFILGRKRLQQLTADLCPKNNEFFYASLEQGSKTSQPSKLHKYWMMQHDVVQGNEVVVRVKIDPKRQKYWSLVVYDQFGLPLPQYVYDDNALKTPMPSSGARRMETRHSEQQASAEGVYCVDIRLRNGSHSAGGAPWPQDDDANVVDVSACSSGYVLFRINHPTDEDVVEFSTPVAKLNAVSDDFKKSN